MSPQLLKSGEPLREAPKEETAGKPKPWIQASALLKSGLTQLDDFGGRGAPPKIVQTLGFSWSVRKSWKYLEGVPALEKDGSFDTHPWVCGDPWDVQVLPHIHMQDGARQVRESEGYFTEVAVRMKPGWGFVVGVDSASRDGVHPWKAIETAVIR